MWKQFVDATARVCRQALQDVLQVQIGIVPIEPVRINQGYHRRCPLTRAQAAGK